MLLAIAPIRQDLVAQEDQLELKWPAPQMQEVETSLRAWAKAWANKNPEAYLSFYSETFKLPRGTKRSAWENERRKSLTKPAYIRITLKDIDVELLDTDTVRTRFTQVYRASNYSDQTRKIILFRKIDNSWKILTEQIAPNPDRPKFPEILPGQATRIQRTYRATPTTSLPAR